MSNNPESVISQSRLAELSTELEGLLAGFVDSKEKLDAVLHFYRLLLQENEVQNLTRLVSPKDFFEGHFLDVFYLQKFLSGAPSGETVMDLGSGGGVPGLLSAVLDSRRWVLVDSEARKAEFLMRAAQELGLSERVRAISGRGEGVLAKEPSISTVLARAVGSVEKIYGWIGRCSTWNTLILFKGPGWGEEWNSFTHSGHRNQLIVQDQFEYEVGSEKKKRVLVRLFRPNRRR